MTLLLPHFLKKIRSYIDKGYKLDDILKEYTSQQSNSNNYGEFINEIKIAYYHLNHGPDLRDYQDVAVNEAMRHFESHSRSNYKLFWCCGLGKTKTAISIPKKMNCKSILIGVPNILLLDQFVKDLEIFYPLSKIYKVYSKSDQKDANHRSHESSKLSLTDYITSDLRYKIIVTTYHSSEKIVESLKTLDFMFDMVILDECHHLQAKKQKQFCHILDVPFKSRVLSSATPYIDDETSKLHSLSQSSQFMGIDNTKSVAWGIKNGYITNYKIIVFNVLDSEITIPEFKRYNSKMVLAAFMCIKSIVDKQSKKMIIYANKVENSKMIQEIIRDLITNHRELFNTNIDISDIGNYELNGKDKISHRNHILDEFSKKEYGIMSSVQLFGEGFDYPELDSVLFAEQMSSDIRIVQSALRPCRRDPNNRDKVAKILLPIFRDDLSKVKQVLLKMKTVDNIIDKIEIIDVNNLNSITSSKKTKKISTNLNRINSDLLEKIELEYLDSELKSIEINNINSQIEYTDETKIILCPVSDHSFKNYYRSIYSSELEQCYWGLKYGNNEKQWIKLKINDYILLVEKSMITIGKISELVKNKQMSNQLWGSEDFELLIKFTLLKRIKYKKRDFMTEIGYKSTDNLMGCRIYRDKTENILCKFTNE